MLLRPDDDIYRARLVWLGPPGYTLPVQLPYAQYGMFAAFAAPLLTLAWLIIGSPFVIGPSLAAAGLATWLIWEHVDPDRPARKILATGLRDWRHTKPIPAGPLPRPTTSHITTRSL